MLNHLLHSTIRSPISSAFCIGFDKIRLGSASGAGETADAKAVSLQKATRGGCYKLFHFLANMVADRD
jgi:hypothetical protein